MLLGRVIERLTKGIQYLQLDDSSSKRKRPASSHSPQQRTTTTVQDDDLVDAGLANVNVGEDDDDDDVSEEDEYEDMEVTAADEDEDEDDDDENENDIAKTKYLIEKQKQQATQQLASLLAELRQRLVRAKERLEEYFQPSQLGSIYDAKQNEIDSMMSDDVKDASDNKGLLSITDILAKVKEAIGWIDLQTAPSRAGQNLSVPDTNTKDANKQQNVITLADIQAAIADWKHVSQVKQALDNKGRVHPIFHTLFLPNKFLNHPRSWKKVTAGKVDRNRIIEFDDYGKNLDEVVVVDEDGMERGARSISDKKLESQWDFSADQTDFAVDLVNTDAEMLGENIECTTLKAIPAKVNPDDMASEQLLTRPESRGVVAEIFHRFATKLNGGSVSAITGSPGIGKSWTLFYALQQALHYDGATVMFFFQKPKDAVLYLRRNNKIYAWTSLCKGAASSNLFKQPAVLVLLDPAEAKYGGAQFALDQAKLIFAASNNVDHFKNAVDKFNKNLYTFLGPPLDEELHVILKRLDPRLKRCVIQSRKKEVGNLVRYILDENYERRVHSIELAVRNCTGNDQSLEAVVQNEGMSAGKQTIPGRLFVVFPGRPSQPTDTGYDGQNVDYHDRVVEAATENVRKAIVKSNRKVVLSYWNKVSDAESSKLWEMQLRDCSSKI